MKAASFYKSVIIIGQKKQREGISTIRQLQIQQPVSDIRQEKSQPDDQANARLDQ
jgi:hypothetical protein